MIVENEPVGSSQETVDLLKIRGGKKAVSSFVGFCAGYVIIILSILIMSVDFGFISERFESVIDNIGLVLLLVGVCVFFFSHRFIFNPFNIARFVKWLLNNRKSLTRPPSSTTKR